MASSRPFGRSFGAPRSAGRRAPWWASCRSATRGSWWRSRPSPSSTEPDSIGADAGPDVGQRSLSTDADRGGGVTLAFVVGTAGLVSGTRFPHEIVVVLGEEVVAPAPVTDVLQHLVPPAVGVLALR